MLRSWYRPTLLLLALKEIRQATFVSQTLLTLILCEKNNKLINAQARSLNVIVESTGVHQNECSTWVP